MYDYQSAFEAMFTHNTFLIYCFLGNIVFAFIYFTIGVVMAIKHKIYVLPFIPTALFFWHDLTFVLQYKVWFEVYAHWWFQLTCMALVVTVAFEAFLLHQFYRYGHRELFPDMAKSTFGLLISLGTLGIGAIWYLIKGNLNDDLWLVTFALTAVFSIPFHTGIMLRRRSRAGQSIVMELSVMVIFTAVSAAFWKIAPELVLSPGYIAFYVVFMIWPLVNIYLMQQLPKEAPFPQLQPLPGWSKLVATNV